MQVQFWRPRSIHKHCFKINLFRQIDQFLFNLLFLLQQFSRNTRKSFTVPQKYHLFGLNFETTWPLWIASNLKSHVLVPLPFRIKKVPLPTKKRKAVMKNNEQSNNQTARVTDFTLRCINLISHLVLQITIFFKRNQINRSFWPLLPFLYDAKFLFLIIWRKTCVTFTLWVFCCE